MVNPVNLVFISKRKLKPSKLRNAETLYKKYEKLRKHGKHSKPLKSVLQKLLECQNPNDLSVGTWCLPRGFKEVATLKSPPPMIA